MNFFFLLALLIILSKLTYCLFSFSESLVWGWLAFLAGYHEGWLLDFGASSSMMQLAVQFAFVAWNKHVWLESWLSVSALCSNNVWTFYFISMFKTFGCPSWLSLVGHVMKWLESCLSVHHVVTYGHFILLLCSKACPCFHGCYQLVILRWHVSSDEMFSVVLHIERHKDNVHSTSVLSLCMKVLKITNS